MQVALGIWLFFVWRCQIFAKGRSDDQFWLGPPHPGRFLSTSSSGSKCLASNPDPTRYDYSGCDTVNGSIYSSQCQISCRTGYTWGTQQYEQIAEQCTDLTKITDSANCKLAVDALHGPSSPLVNPVNDVNKPPFCFADVSSTSNAYYQGNQNNAGTCDYSNNQCICKYYGSLNGQCPTVATPAPVPGETAPPVPDGTFTHETCIKTCGHPSTACPAGQTKKENADYIPCAGDVCDMAMCCVQSCFEYVQTNPCPSGTVEKKNSRNIAAGGDLCCEKEGAKTCQRGGPLPTIGEGRRRRTTTTTTAIDASVCHGREFTMNTQISVTNLQQEVYRSSNDRLAFDTNLDILVGRANGRIRFYRRTSGGLYSKAAATNNPYNNLDFGANAVPAIGDLNKDSYDDLIVGSKSGGVFFCKRTRSVYTTLYQANCSLLVKNTADGKLMEYTYPALTDYDGDNDLDLFVGRIPPTGDPTTYDHDFTLVYFENMWDNTQNWWIPQNFSFSERPEMAYTFLIKESAGSRPALVDWDGDNDHDLIVGGATSGALMYLERMSSGLFLERVGSSDPMYGLSTDESNTAAIPLPVDWNQDGNLDLFIAGGTPARDGGVAPVYVQRTPTSGVVDRPGTSNPFMGITFGLQARPVLVNWDDSADGKLELIVATEGEDMGTTAPINFYEQDQYGVWWTSSRATDQLNVIITVTAGTPMASPSAADWDGDNKMDLIVGTNELDKAPVYYKGKVPDPCTPGTGGQPCPVASAGHLSRQPDSANPFMNVPPSSGSGGNYWTGKTEVNPQVADFDDDGTLDLIAYSKPDGICWFKYDGSMQTWSTCVRITSESSTTYGDSRWPLVADWDGDADLDLFVGTDDGLLQFWIRDGAAATDTQQLTGTSGRQALMNPILVDGSAIDVGSNAAPAVGDLDNNGVLDVIVGAASGDISVYLTGWCQAAEACALKGLCHPRTGRCQCLPEYDYGAYRDCSACSSGYFRYPLVQDPLFCQRCPSENWDYNNPICAKRGTCNDDEAARNAQNKTSHSLAMIVQGTGNCTCNTPFTGNVYMQGIWTMSWTSCHSGSCPAGLELISGTTSAGSNSELESCMNCSWGRSKQGEGNGPTVTGEAQCMDCPFGTHQNSTGATECKSCEKGRYSSGTRQWSCSGCMIGRYQDQEGQQDCTDCPAGKSTRDSSASNNCSGTQSCYMQWDGFTDCYTCPGGMYSEARSERCYECLAGSYSPPGSTSCTTCETGRFSNRSSTLCTQCPIGKIASMQGSRECTSCPAGKRPNEDKDACDNCQDGYTSNEGSAVCKACPAGTYSDGGTSFVCTNCAAGKYAQSASDQCADCDAGKYSNFRAGAVQPCANCGAGTYSAAGADACTACSAGRFSSGGVESCDECPAGKYAGGVYAEACDDCPAGTYSPPAAPGCIQCATGSVASANSGSCTQCQPGTFANASESCLDCPPGRVSQASGEIACDTCDVGMVPNSDATWCENCPDGRYQQDAGCIECAKGKFATAGSGMCTTCEGGRVSSAGAAACDQCEAGKHSPSAAGMQPDDTCHTCAAGYRAAAGSVQCTACTAGQVAPAGSENCALCNAGSVPSTDGSQCEPCAAGKFAQTASTRCDPCSSGRFSPAGAGECTNCPEGKFADKDGSAACTNCSAGKASVGGLASCAVCLPGKSAGSGKRECVDCDAGWYAAAESAQCTACGNGTFSAKASGQCTSCNPGQVAGAQSPACNSCIAGRYAATSTCEPCPAGKSAGALSSACTICTKGKHAGPSSPTCTDCVSGTYSGEQAGACSTCASGRISAAGSPSCTVCAAGRYVLAGVCELCPGGKASGEGAAVCTDCGVGRSASAGSPSCTLCTAGRAAQAGDATCEACNAGKASAAGAGACTPCGAGTYAEGEAGKCTDCIPGKASEAISSVCDTCGAGRYSAAKAAACIVCADGKSAGVGAAGCTVCGTGKKSSAAKDLCETCPAGRYAGEGSSVCTVCAEGAFSSAGAGECIACAAGRKASANKDLCEACPAGKYSSASAEKCGDCLNGFYSLLASAGCTECAAGRKSSATKGACEACAAGTYAPAKSSACTPCANGFFSIGDAAACTECAKGKKAAANKAACESCPAGTYAPAQSTACTPCPFGFSSSAESGSCTECAAGKKASANKDVCESCPAGTYAAARSSACTACADGFYSGADSGSCTECAAGKKASANKAVCESCPAGTYSAAKSSACTACADGFYSVADSGTCTECAGGKKSSTNKDVCESCPAGKYAPAKSSVCTDCQGGFSSILASAACTECQGGRKSSANRAACETCPAGTYAPPKSSVCTICKDGFFSKGDAAGCLECAAGKKASANKDVCESCPAGTYAPAQSSACTACAGGFYSLGDAATCTECAAGKKSSATKGVCDSCPAGKYAPAQSSVCTDCAAGFSSVLDSAICTECAAGKKASANKDVCESCPVGKYAPARSSVCTVCEDGFYSLGNAAACTECAAGKKASANKAACETCPAGKYAPAQSSVCTDCAAGFSSILNSAICTECAAGKKASADKAVCESCPAGKFAPARSSVCTDCDAGFYATLGSGACIACAAGRKSAVNKDSCETCPAGTYASAEASECTDCEAGQASDLGAPSCTDCAAGTYTTDRKSCFQCAPGRKSLAKATNCTICAAGRSAGAGSVSCFQCDAGKFAPAESAICSPCTQGRFAEAASAECSVCTAGTFSAAAASVCGVCAAGSFSLNESSQCSMCPAGTYSGERAGFCTQCTPGKYSLSGGQVDASSCQDCPLGKYGGDFARTIECSICPSGSTTSTVAQIALFDCLCNAGYEATLGNNSLTCTLCSQGTYKAGLNHDPCQSCDTVLHGGVTVTVGAVDNTNCYCPPGNYFLPNTAGPPDTCQVCPVGFYCLGLPTSHGKTKCIDGATTAQAGSTQATDCKCGPGWFKASATECAVCPAGRYKSGVVDSSSCPGECPPASTSSAGSRSASNCQCLPNYEDSDNGTGLNCTPMQASGEATGTDSMAVPAVQGALNFEGVTAPNDPPQQLQFAQDLANQIAAKMGLPAPGPCEQVASPTGTFKARCGDIDVGYGLNVNATANASSGAGSGTGGRRLIMDKEDCLKDNGSDNGSFSLHELHRELGDAVHDGSAARRLDHHILQTSYTVRVPTEADAAQKAQDFQPAELVNGLRETSQFASNIYAVETATAPAVTQALTTCPATRAFPAGSTFVSMAVSCQCMAGYEPSSVAGALECDPCRQDYYKQQASNDPCEQCPLNRGTFNQGTNTSKMCFCKEGYSVNASGVCIKCPPRQYCPFDKDNKPKDCPNGTETLSTRRILDDCLCSKGWGLSESGDECTVCTTGRFSDAVADLECRPCETNMQSPNGSTDALQCSCLASYYYAWSKKLMAGRCERCNVPGVICNGGFYNGTQSHVKPYADVDYYLTGELRAVKCRIHEDDTSYCLGGHEKKRPCLENCNCREGHDGFMCQNCKAGYTRPRFDVPCRTCEDLGPTWWMILVLNGGCAGSSLVYIILASMAAAAGQSTRRVHTALLRLWQSWVLSMVCLKQFDFSEVELFKWSIEQAQASFLADNPDADEEEEEAFLSALTFDIPPWFQEMADWVYGVSEFLISIGSPTEAMNCLAEKFMGKEEAYDYRHYWHAMWWAASPFLVLIWTIIFSAIIVYIVFPPLDKRGWFPPSNPIEFRDWAFKLLKEKLRKAIRKLGCAEKDEEEILAEMRVLFGQMDFGFRTLEAVAGNPVGGLGPMMGRLEDEQKERAKRVVFLIFRPKMKRAMEKFASTFFPKGKSKDGEDEQHKKHREHSFMHPWAEKVQVFMWPLLAGLGFDMLVGGLKDPSGLIESLTDSDDGQMFLIQLMMPAFRMAGFWKGCDLSTLDEVWVEIEDVLSECSLSSVTTALMSSPDEALESLCRIVMGPPGSFVYILHKRPEIVEYLASEEGGSLEGDELTNSYRKILFYSGSVELELLMAWSPAQIAANAMSYTFDGTVSDRYKMQMEEMREEALRLENEAVLYLAEGASGNIANYPVLGIWHAMPKPWQFLLDTRPLILIALYTMWYETTKQLLLLNHCDPFAVEDKEGRISMDERWMKHANWKCMEWGSKHIPVALISGGGLFMWSLGTLLGLAFLVFRNRRRMAEPEVSRLYAYFVQGYEIEYCWWDVLIKRLDLLCTIAITYTNVAPDRKAKLLCYTALAAVVLMLHAGAAPFDDRKNRLLDRYEYYGLLVRFMTYTVIQLLLVFNPGLYVAIVFCALIGLCGTLFFLSIWTTILIEFTADAVNRGHEATAEDLEELLDSGMGDFDHQSGMASFTGAVTSPMKKLAKCCGKYVFAFAMQAVLQVAKRIGLFYSQMEHKALAIKFGDGTLNLWTRREQEDEAMQKKQTITGKTKRSKKELIKLKAEHGLEAFFHQNDGAQREYLATVIGAYYVHVLCTMGADGIPARSLECFLVLSASMKAAKIDLEVQWLSKNVDEKSDLMIEGIPDAVKKIKGEMGQQQQEGDLPEEGNPMPEFSQESADGANEPMESSQTEPGEAATASNEPNIVDIDEVIGARREQEPLLGAGVGLASDDSLPIDHQPVGDVPPPVDDEEDLPTPAERTPIQSNMPGEADPTSTTADSAPEAAPASDTRNVSISASKPEAAASTSTGGGRVSASSSIATPFDPSAANLLAGGAAVGAMVEEELEEAEQEKAEEKMRLHAEELNETLMILFRIQHSKLSGAFEKVDKCWEGTWVDPEAEQNENTEAEAEKEGNEDALAAAESDGWADQAPLNIEISLLESKIFEVVQARSAESVEESTI